MTTDKYRPTAMEALTAAREVERDRADSQAGAEVMIKQLDAITELLSRGTVVIRQ